MTPDQLLAHYEQVADAPDAIPRLRRFILDLAVRGKLVVQDPNDEPASELLKRIAAEKARLVKAGEIRKLKALPNVDEAPFELPHSWQWTRMRRVTSDRGQTVPNAPFTYIDVTSIDKENGIVADPKVLEANTAPSRARKITRKGDVVYSCVRPYLLNVAVVDDDYDPAPIASTAFAVLNGHGLVLPRYLWIVLRSPFMVECVEANMRGQAYPAINDSDFSILPFPLSPLAEQHRIAAKIDELMALCDRLEAARAEREATRDRLAAASLARLNQPDPDPAVFRNHAAFALDNLSPLTTRPDQIKVLRQTILNLAVRGKLVEQDPEDEPVAELLNRLKADIQEFAKVNNLKMTQGSPVDKDNSPISLPTSWSWTRLAMLCRVVTDGDHQPPPKADEGVAFLTIGNVTTGKISFANCRWVPPSYFESLPPYRTPKFGDLLYTVVGATFGRPVFVDTRTDFCVQRHIAILKPADGMSVPYLHMTLASPFVYEQAASSTTGAAQPTITLKPLRKFLIPLPPLAEQHRIAEKVEELMALCDRLEASLDQSATTRRRLLDALLHEALAPSTRELEAAE